MLSTIIWTLIAVAFLAYVARSKFLKRKEKQWEGRNPNERIQSTEELRQNENKYRKPDGGTDGGM
jgi:hypothetical protein